MIKRVFIICIIFVLCFSVVSTFATTDFSNGTNVSYTGNGTISYVVTVPALLSPGQSGEVSLSGTWPSNYVVEVISDEQVVLSNNINENDKHELKVSFAGIKKVGDNTKERTYLESITVSEMPENVLFGIWSGVFNYNVELIPQVIDANMVYTRTYLIDGMDEDVCPSTLMLNDNGTATLLIGEDTETVPANLFEILGNEINVNDDSMYIEISSDGSKISLYSAATMLLVAEWTLS